MSELTQELLLCLSAFTGVSSATPLLPSSPSSPEDVLLLSYTLRSHLALSSPPASFATLLGTASASEDPLLRAVVLLSELGPSTSDANEDVLEKTRDLAIELEDVEDAGGAKAVVGTVFVKAGEWVEAVDVLSSEEESLEW